MMNLNHKIYVGHETSCFGGYQPRELYLTDLKDICDVRLDEQPAEEGYTRDRYRGEVIHHGKETQGVFTIFHSGNGRVEILYDCPEELREEIEEHQRNRWLPIAIRTLIRYTYLTSALPMGLLANYLLFHGRLLGFIEVFVSMLVMREIYNWVRNNIR